MAERTVNVTINYKVNTAEVQKATAASHAAQKATDDLRRASENYGKASASAHRQAALGAKDASQSFTGLYNSVRLIVAAGIFKEIADASINMAKLAGNTEAVARAFKNQIPDSVRLLGELRKATLGTTNDLELMQQSLRALNFGISLDRLPTLLKFAQIRAQQTGQSVEYLTNSIVDGLGRKSLLKLDNLQVSASRLRDEFKGVALQSLSVAEVTEGFANVVDEELVKMGEAVENSATLVDQMSVAFHDFKTEASDSGFWKGVVANLKGMAEAATAALKALKGESFDDQIKKKQIADIASVSANEFMSRRLTKDKQENIEILKEEIQHITHELGLFAKGKDLAEKTIKLNGELIRSSPYGSDTHALRDNIDLQRDWIADKEYDATIDQEILKLLQARLVSLQKVNKEEKGGDELGGDKKEKLKKVKEEGAEIRDYLASLSEQEMFQTKELLDEKSEQRAHETDVEIENAKRSYDHWLYYQDLKKQKQQEAADEAIRIEEDQAARIAELQRATYSLAEELAMSLADLFTTSRASELDNIRTFYDDQLAIAGDNDRAKKELQIKRDRELEKVSQQEKERDKKNAATRIAIDGLVAIAKIFSQWGWPGGIAPAAIMAGITAVNVATVRKFAKGGINIDGPGTGTSDDIPARLSKGESVITAKATRNSMGLLELVQANKIDDRLLKSIDFSGGRTINTSMNDERIVGELKAIRKSQYKLEEQAGMIYRVYTDDDGNKKRIRSKSLNG